MKTNKMVVCSMLQTFTHPLTAMVSLCARNECINFLLTGPHEPEVQSMSDRFVPTTPVQVWRFHRHPFPDNRMVFSVVPQWQGHKSASGWKHIDGQGSGWDAGICGKGRNNINQWLVLRWRQHNHCCAAKQWHELFFFLSAQQQRSFQIVSHIFLSNQRSTFVWIINGWAQNTICCGGLHEFQHSFSRCVAHLHVIKFVSSQLSLHGGGLFPSMLLATIWFKTFMSHNDLSSYIIGLKQCLSSDVVF